MSDETKTLRQITEYEQRKIETIIYKKIGDLELELHVSKPDDWEIGQKRTAIVWVHGGGWTAGAPEAKHPHMRYAAERGAVGFSVQYRLMSSVNYKHNPKLSSAENSKKKQERMDAFISGPGLKDLVDDLEDSIRYIRANASALGVDPQKIVAIGDSAGSHLSACLASITDKETHINALIVCSSISDLTTGFGPDFVKPTPGFESKDIGEDEERMRRAKALSPMHNTKKNTSVLILAGGSDWLKDEPKNYYQALEEADADVEYIEYPTAKHAFIVYGYSATLSEITQALLDIDRFLVQRKYLSGKSMLQFPGKNVNDEIILESPVTFSEEKIIKQNHDFTDFMTISLKVKPLKNFNGSLFELSGRYGARIKVNKNGYIFSTIRINKRGGEIKLIPEKWQDFVISLGPKKVIIQSGEQKLEIQNTVGQTFVSNEIIFNKGLNAEMKDIRIYGNYKE
ncbi:MAG: alpha/beta hydrolase [Lentisphaeria bacterium]|nr:alpha/beta hydrolase [Lentisphaeria bacterium]